MNALWLLAVTVALVLGFWLGRHHTQLKYSEILEKGYVNMTRADTVSDGVCHGRQACGVLSQSPAKFQPGGEEGDFIPEFVNQGLRELWPYVDDLVRRKLITEVEGQLKNEMPAMLKDIHFVESRCTLGKKPVMVPRAEVVPKKEDSSILGEYRNLVIKAEVKLDNSCDVALAVDVAPGIFGHAMRLTLDVTEIKLHGSMVFEFVRLAPKASMFGGFRLYFLDPPTVDITMGGSLKRVLHWAFVKRALLDTIVHHLDDTLVLPNMIGCPLMPELQIFQVRAPRPDGLLRVSVGRLAGMKCNTGNVVVILAVGGAGRRPLKVGSDEVAAFTFGCRTSQHMLVEVYQTQHSKLLGDFLGNCIAAARIPLKDLLKDDHMSSRQCWFDLVLASKKKRQRSQRDPSHQHSSPDDVSSHDEYELEMGSLPSAGQSRTLQSSSKMPQTSTSAEQAMVELCVEWRSCCTAVPKPCMDFRLRDGGTTTSTTTPDIKFLILVGVYGVNNVSSALDGGKCWCDLECIGERHPVSISGAPMDSEKHSRKKYQWSAMTHKAQTSKQTVVATDDTAFGAPIEEEEDWTCKYRDNVTWDEAFVFAVTEPELAQINVDVQWKAKGKEPGKLGSTIIDVEPVLSMERPTVIFEEVLKSGDISQMKEQSTISRAHNVIDESFTVASTTRTLPRPMPTLRLVVKIWFFTDMGEDSRPRPPTPEDPKEAFRQCFANKRARSSV